MSLSLVAVGLLLQVTKSKVTSSRMALFQYFSLFQQIFIAPKSFTVGIKTKNVAGFGFCLFYNVVL